MTTKAEVETLSDFLEREIKAELAGMVVGTLIKTGFLLAKQCGASRPALEHAIGVFLDEVYR